MSEGPIKISLTAEEAREIIRALGAQAARLREWSFSVARPDIADGFGIRAVRVEKIAFKIEEIAAAA